MSPNLPRHQERHGPRLWHVWIVLPLTFVTAIAIAAGVFFAGWDLLGAQGLKPQRQLTSQTLFDLVKLSFGVVAGAGALVALIVAYRRQRVDEDGALRDATRLHTERFTTAVSQLGEESAAVRLGGVHALAGLADDAPTRDLRQTCIDVLCAYIRLPYAYVPEVDPPSDDVSARHAYMAMREVRHTTLRLIRDHLRLPPEHPHSWRGHDLDFTGAVFDGGDFSGAVFSGGTVSFSGAVFSGGTVSFSGAVFSGGTVSFSGAVFSGGTVPFTDAAFSGGTVDFDQVHFSGATVRFTSAAFSGGTVDFFNAVFSSGSVDFFNAIFAGGTVSFSAAHFSGATVRFGYSHFSGATVRFAGARFSDATVSFARANFSGSTVFFDQAHFSGATVDFNDAHFSGGTVRFTDVSGFGFPSGLVPQDGQPLPPGLSLPQSWYPPTS